MDSIIRQSARLACDARSAFRMFTDNSLLQTWLAPLAEVEPVAGGKYELFWEPDERENNSTIGCRVTAIVPDELLSFEWKGPQQFKSFMNEADPLTHVVVLFVPSANEAQDFTDVHLVHTGWRRAPDWEEARQWFEKSWAIAFEGLKRQASSRQLSMSV
jgi:uncharacterized protein YndB with AHSA1/START domain